MLPVLPGQMNQMDLQEPQVTIDASATEKERPDHAIDSN